MSANVLKAIEPIDVVSRPTNLKEAWEQYQSHLQAKLDAAQALSEIRSTQTALLRYTLPGWGGPVPLSERLSPIEITAGIEFSASVSLVQFQTARAVFDMVLQKLQTDAQEQKQAEPKNGWKKYFQGLRKRNGHYLNKLWDWVNELGWFERPEAPKQSTKPYRFYNQVEGKAPLKSIRLGQRKQTNQTKEALAQPHKGKVREDIYALGQVPGDVINSALQAHLADFSAFLTDGRMGGECLRKPSADNRLNDTLRILGYFHRVKDIPFDALRLETLVPFVRLNLFEECPGSLDQMAIQSWRARKEAKRQANEIEASVRQYWTWLDSRIVGNQPLSLRSKQQIVHTWTAVAKYIYRMETDQDETDDFEDIPAVRRLRKLSRELSKQAKNIPNVINEKKKMVSWTALLTAVEQLRFEAELDRLPTDGEKRSQAAQAKSRQRFLMLGFMSNMPPDRQRTYREFKVGRTLVKGELVGEEFTASDHMADPQKAKWYIHLEPPDYKTGETYGEWWGEVPNVVYPDGKTFYGYIEEWLTHWRQVFAPNHEYFFTQPNGKPMTATAVKSLVQHALYRLLHVPVAPHVLRNMFITYLAEQQLPEHIHDSAALAMHHSRRMAKRYNRQEQSAKLQPSFSLAVELVQQVVTPKLPVAQVQATAHGLKAA